MTTPTPTRELIDSAPDLEAPRYGLLSVAQLPAEAPGHWQLAGVAYDSDHCAEAGSVDGACPVITPPAPVTQNASVVFTPTAVTPPPVDVTVTYTSEPEFDNEVPVTLEITSKRWEDHPEKFEVTVASSSDSQLPVTVTLNEVSKSLAVGSHAIWYGLDETTYTLTYASPEGGVFEPMSTDYRVGEETEGVDGHIGNPTGRNTLSAVLPAGAPSAIGVTVGSNHQTLQPGSKIEVRNQNDGAVTITYDAPGGTVSPKTSQVTLPLTTAANRKVTIQPADTYTVAAASPQSSQFPVTFASTPAGVAGTRGRGQNSPAGTGLAAGTYKMAVTGPKGATGKSVDLVVPGDAVTLAATRQAPGPPRPEDSSHYKPKKEGLNVVDGFGPFTTYHRFECNPVGMGEDVHATARRRLQLAEWRQVEARHWAQMLEAHDAGDAIDLGVAEPGVDFKTAVGFLEFGARHYGTLNGLPVLHVPLWAQPYFGSLIEDRDRDGIMRSKLGSRVAFYSGHDDAANDARPGSFLAFATGPVRAFRTDIFSNESFDPPTNTRTVIAERTWALDHDCLLAVIRISVPGLA